MVGHEEVEALLAGAGEHLTRLEETYGHSLEAKEVTHRLKSRIRGVLEGQRSALDRLAVLLTERFGDPKAASRATYPLADGPDALDAAIDASMPGVRKARPDVTAEIGRWQPHNRPSLAALRLLTEGWHRRRLTPQVRKEHVSPGGTMMVDPQVGQWSPGFQGPTIYPVPGGQAEHETYVDWRFAELDAPVLATLRELQEHVAAAVRAVLAAASR